MIARSVNDKYMISIGVLRLEHSKVEWLLTINLFPVRKFLATVRTHGVCLVEGLT